MQGAVADQKEPIGPGSSIIGVLDELLYDADTSWVIPDELFNSSREALLLTKITRMTISPGRRVGTRTYTQIAFCPSVALALIFFDCLINL